MAAAIEHTEPAAIPDKQDGLHHGRTSLTDLAASVTIPAAELSSGNVLATHRPLSTVPADSEQLKSKNGTETTSPSAQSAPPVGNTENFSRFMALPRELRDCIYEHLHHQVVKKSTSSVPNRRLLVTVFFALRATLLRISKQFSTEYEERMRGRGVLQISSGATSPLEHVEDYKLFVPLKYIHHFRIWTFNRITRNQTKVLRRLEAYCCGWIDQIKSLPGGDLEFEVKIILWALSEEKFQREALQAKIQSARDDEPDAGPDKDLRQDPGLLARVIDRKGVQEIKIQETIGIDSDGPWTIGRWTPRKSWKSKKAKRVKDEEKSKCDTTLTT